VSRGGGDTPEPAAPVALQGPQLRLGDLTYLVTDIRVLDRDRPADAPYLTNLQALPAGRAYFGVFLKIYNNADEERPSAPGYLLEPMRAPGLVVQNQWSESPYKLDQGGMVPARGVIPVPGSPAAAGPIDGGLLLYVIKSAMTAAQPFRLIINAGNELGAVKLPPVPKLTGGADH
jgi:hypothetical protein